MVLNFTADFDTEDDADFGIGTNDLSISWLSQSSTESGDTVSGWFVQSGIRQEFDAAMEALNADRVGKRLAEIPRITVIHRLSGAKVEYWYFQELNLFLLIRGIREPLVKEGAPYGIVNYYETLKTGKVKSHLRIRVLLRDLVEQGYLEPLQIAVTGKGKTVFLKEAIKKQELVLSAYRTLQQSKGIPLPYWAFSLPIMRSKSLQKVKGEGDDTLMILPMANLPQVIDEKYLQSHFVTTTVMGNDLKGIIKRHVEDSLQWAQSFTVKPQQSQPPEENNQEASMLDEEYMNAPYEGEEATSANPGKLATDAQRETLRKMSTRPGEAPLLAIATDSRLTFDMAGKAITEANQRWAKR